MQSKAEQVAALFTDALVHDRELQQAARAQEKGTTLKTNPYITDAGSECDRKIWYSLRNYPVTNPVTTDSLANFLLGKSAEEGYARVLEQLGVQVVREIRVDLGKATGRLDFLLFFQELEALVELKTTSRLAMKMHGYQPYSQHESQLNLYLHATHTPGSIALGSGCATEALSRPLELNLPAVQTGVLFYLVKDAAKRQKAFYSFDVFYDRDRALTDLARLEELDTLAKLGSIGTPERPKGFKADRFPCSYCDFSSGCWSGKWDLTAGV